MWRLWKAKEMTHEIVEGGHKEIQRVDVYVVELKGRVLKILANFMWIDFAQ